ncbi:unnamed protein product [Cuscuta campestris]|uniref:Uncharacterized protein n=1 Tax=Cuscuta campestris TaxID=132261 RepID=A0A484L0V9_9ASTE|nr:unnamed protein product [Cuscuta campestris]
MASEDALDEIPLSKRLEKIQHIEIAMFYLELKSIQYSLIQTYTTASPYFLHARTQDAPRDGRHRKGENGGCD